MAEGTIECVGGGGGDCGVRLHCQDAMTQLAEAVVVTHTHIHRHYSLSDSRKTVTTHVNVIYSTHIHIHALKDRTVPTLGL